MAPRAAGGLPCAAVALQLKKIIFDFSLHRFAASRYVSQRVAVREDGVPMIAVAADCIQRHHHFLCRNLLKSSPKCVLDCIQGIITFCVGTSSKVAQNVSQTPTPQLWQLK